MKYTDCHDARKADIETNMIRAAELKAQEAEKYQGIGKAAYEAFIALARCEPGYFYRFYREWSELDGAFQVAWVEAAKAAVRANLENNE